MGNAWVSLAALPVSVLGRRLWRLVALPADALGTNVLRTPPEAGKICLDRAPT